MLLLTWATLVIVVQLAISDDYNDGSWRKTLLSCWTDSACNRALVVSHGGDWGLSAIPPDYYPYDSMPGFQRANDKGADVVKGDYRVTADNVGVVMHSSPVLLYESVDCFGKLVEDMTAEEATSCHMINPKYNFISVPEALSWSEDEVIFMFCVKETSDIPRAISTLVVLNATDRAFLEIGVDDMLDLVTNDVPEWDQVYYVIELGSADELSRMLAASPTVLKRTFMFEFNNIESWDHIQDSLALTTSAGIRTFSSTHDNPVTATVHNHMDIYRTGFDVVYSYNLDNAIVARKRVNRERNISPP